LGGLNGVVGKKTAMKKKRDYKKLQLFGTKEKYPGQRDLGGRINEGRTSDGSSAFSRMDLLKEAREEKKGQAANGIQKQT